MNALIKSEQLSLDEMTIYPSHYFFPLHYKDILDEEALSAYIPQEDHYCFQVWGSELGYSPDIMSKFNKKFNLS